MKLNLNKELQQEVIFERFKRPIKQSTRVTRFSDMEWKQERRKQRYLKSEVRYNDNNE